MGGVYIRCYTVTENGSQMNFDVANANSIGYVRAMEDQNSTGKHILKFYPCWGGFNSSLAANNEFTISLNETDSEIYILDGGGYERLALIKDSESGEWIRP